MLYYGGGLHCVIREIGSNEPIHISHARFYDQSETNTGHNLTATIRSSFPISDAFVCWRSENKSAFKSLPFQLQSDNLYTATIPSHPAGTTIEYYIKAFNSNGKVITKPLTAPDGYWSFKIHQSTGVVADDPTTPAQLELGFNYPNPFNNSTTIPYSLADDAVVQLRILNSIGQEIKILSQYFQQAGTHKVKWDGTDQVGNSVPSGLYVIEMITSSWKAQRKLLLLK
jgi:hypothetical protein